MKPLNVAEMYHNNFILDLIYIPSSALVVVFIS